MTGPRTHRAQLAGGLILALAAGASILALPRPAPSLAAPSACTGLLEFVAVGAARLAPRAPFGPMLLSIQTVLAAIGVGALAWLAYVRTGTWPVALAIGIGAAALPLFEPRLGTLDAATVVLSVMAFAALTAPEAGPRHWRRAGLAILACALAAPEVWFVWVLLGAWCVARSRPGGGITGGVALGALTAAGLAALGWAIPLPGASSEASLLHCIAATAPASVSVSQLGTPYVWGLAALGTFTMIDRWRRPQSLVMLLYAATPLLFTFWTTPPSRAVMPALVAIWLAAAVGLRELVRACMARRGGWIAAAFFLLLVPAAELSPTEGAGVSPPPSDRRQPAAADVRSLVQALPDNAVLVIDDAATDLLLRSVYRSWRGTGKSLTVVNGQVLGVPSALPDERLVFAFPSSARYLLGTGFRRAETQFPELQHVVRLTRAGRCEPVQGTWRVPQTGIVADFSLAAIGEADEGPVVMYVGTADAPSPTPMDWPGRTTRGYNANVYETATGKEALDAILEEDQVPAGLRPAAPFVTRFELWRTPGAPRVLRVHIASPVGSSLARLTAPGQRLFVCAAF